MTSRHSAALVASVLVLTGLLGFAGGAAAQDRRQNEPGQFDFYVLSLSWSPSWCAGAAERGGGRSAEDQGDGERRGRRGDPQCGERPYSFVVHGLWPQYDRGFPEFCQQPAPRIDRGLVASMLDLMPSPRLVFHEWDRHGVCTGLSARAYFETVRKARAAIRIPEAYLDPTAALTVTPDEVEAAFVKANPGLEPSGIAIGCSRNRLSEVRICLTRELGFRACPEVDRRACRREQITMPPVRGG